MNLPRYKVRNSSKTATSKIYLLPNKTLIQVQYITNKFHSKLRVLRKSIASRRSSFIEALRSVIMSFRTENSLSMLTCVGGIAITVRAKSLIISG